MVIESTRPAGSRVEEWPVGKDGDLVVTAGPPSQLSVFEIYDFNSITVEAGGTLQILAVPEADLRFPIKARLGRISEKHATPQPDTTPIGPTWCIVGVLGDFSLKGTLEYYGIPYTPGPHNVMAPDGQSLQKDITLKLGGNGGSNSPWTPGAPTPNGGLQAAGNGGGGAACGAQGGAACVTAAGNGATSPISPNNLCGTGGAGATVQGGSGSQGGDVSSTMEIMSYGGGGGGGMAGRSGGLLYLRVNGNFSAIGGTMNLSGQNGGAGGRGGNAIRGVPGSGGGGGGGGDGGVVIIYHGGAYSPGVYQRTNGSGGQGGIGGHNDPDAFSPAGGNGQDGDVGTLTILPSS